MLNAGTVLFSPWDHRHSQKSIAYVIFSFLINLMKPLDLVILKISSSCNIVQFYNSTLFLSFPFLYLHIFSPAFSAPSLLLWWHPPMGGMEYWPPRIGSVESMSVEKEFSWSLPSYHIRTLYLSLPKWDALFKSLGFLCHDLFSWEICLMKMGGYPPYGRGKFPFLLPPVL